MDKMDVMVFASVCIILSFYTYFQNKKQKNKYKRKIDKEIDEGIQTIVTVILLKNKHVVEK